MSALKSSPPAVGTPAAAAPALSERQLSAVRSYLLQLAGNDVVRVNAVMTELRREAESVDNLEFADDPSVWLFTQGRRRVSGAGQRGERLADENDGGRGDDEQGAKGEDLRIVVHQAIQRMTPKQQEALRLKFQFGFNLEELARITGLSPHGAGGLLHLAVNRVGQAISAATGGKPPSAGDQQLTAFALDELDDDGRKAFAAGSPGKSRFDEAEAIRGWGRQISLVLESGAQLPKRRRRRGVPWWQAKAFWVSLAALLALAGAVYFTRQPKITGSSFRPTTGVNGLGAAPVARAAVADASAGGVGPGQNAGDQLGAGRIRPPRNARATWETKSFGKETDATVTNESDGDKPVDARTETDEAADSRGSKSRGAPSGPTSKLRNPAQARGISGEREKSVNDLVKEPPTEVEETAPKDDFASSPASPSPSSPANQQTQKSAPQSRSAAPERKVPETKSEEKESASRAPTVNLSVLKPGLEELKRQLARKRWPNPEAVRTAEMVKQAPAPPSAPGQRETVEAKLEQARSPWNPGKRIVRVSLRAKDAPVPARPSVNLVFAIDVSRSMGGSNRLPLVQEGIRLLLDRLRPGDHVAIVTYADLAAVALPATPVAQAGAVRSCLAALEAEGLTNGSEGLRLAYATVQQGWIEGGLNELVLCTDGNFNLGTTGETELAAMAAEQAKQGVRLSVFGFGRNDRNDLRLELLAQSGGGRSCYVNTQEEAERLLTGPINGWFAPAASDVRLQVEFNPALVVDFHRLDAGDESGEAVATLLPGRSLTALYEITPKAWAPVDDHALANVRVSYAQPESDRRWQTELALNGAERDWPRTALDFRYATAMTEFARILRGDPITGRPDLVRLEGWVRTNLPDDTGGYRAEMLFCLEQAKVAAAQSPLAEAR